MKKGVSIIFECLSVNVVPTFCVCNICQSFLLWRAKQTLNVGLKDTPIGKDTPIVLNCCRDVYSINESRSQVIKNWHFLKFLFGS